MSKSKTKRTGVKSDKSTGSPRTIRREFRMSNDTETFLAKAEQAMRQLFSLAQKQDEFQFALSLSPEFRGCEDVGWNTAHDAQKSVTTYLSLLESDVDAELKIRVALAFYCHLAEAAGFYEVPKNLLNVASGQEFSMWPFLYLTKAHKVTGQRIAPNANKIMQDLVGHSSEIGLTDLAQAFKGAFDPDVRNGYAHADYVVWADGLRLKKRNGGQPRIIPWDEFFDLFFKGINFFLMITNVASEFIHSYCEPKYVQGNCFGVPNSWAAIFYDERAGSLFITGSLSREACEQTIAEERAKPIEQRQQEATSSRMVNVMPSMGRNRA